jgi:hypothetical protein
MSSNHLNEKYAHREGFTGSCEGALYATVKEDGKMYMVWADGKELKIENSWSVENIDYFV